jgi:hypothetical protein
MDEDERLQRKDAAIMDCISRLATLTDGIGQAKAADWFDIWRSLKTIQGALILIELTLNELKPEGARIDLDDLFRRIFPDLEPPGGGGGGSSPGSPGSGPMA